MTKFTFYCFLGSFVLGLLHSDAATNEVDVYLNVRHEVGGVSTFERSKYITIHANNSSGDWNDGVRGANNFTNDLQTAFMVGLDVYYGRDTGYISWHIKNNIDEDPGNPGFVEVGSVGSNYTMVEEGRQSRNSYNAKTSIHSFENRMGGYVIAAQFQPFWPEGNNDCGRTGSKWALSTNDTPAEPFGTATGHYMGHFMNEFYGHASQAGPPLPTYVEVMNEPDWPLFEDPGDPEFGTSSPAELWKFHNSVATEMRNHNTNVLIGGYCPAFPDLERDDFAEWEDEWVTFIDTCGTNMDFYTLHFYDIDEESPVRLYTRRGSWTEAVFDMIEHYSQLQLGKQLPFLITEYAGKDTPLYQQGWSAYYDWKRIKSMSGYLLHFMDRPDLIGKTIPFTMLKEEWWRNFGDGIPHGARLMRQIDETTNPTNATGEWVYTEHVKWYQLWSDVNGTRVDIVSSDPDIQVDCYVDSDKAYVILNNLTTELQTVALGLFENHSNTVTSIREKNLYWDAGVTNVALDDIVHAGSLSHVDLGSEGTAILEYTFAAPLTLDETSDEVKHYATTYFQPISNSVANVFTITNVTKGAYGAAELRLGAGREKSLYKRPTVLFNGVPLVVPTDFMGHEGDSRSTFFGVLEIPVPYNLVQSSNTIAVTYPDSGGYISSVAMRTFEFSSDIRSLSYDIPIDWYSIADPNIALGFTNGPVDGYFSLLSKSNLLDSGWSLSQTELLTDGLGDGAVTNPMSGSVEFFKIVESDSPLPVITPPPPPVTYDFTWPPYINNAQLNGQDNWNAELGWTVRDANGSGRVDTTTTYHAATKNIPVTLNAGEKFGFTLAFDFSGSYSQPIGFVYSFLAGMKSSSAGASVATDSTAADANIQLIGSTDNSRLLNNWSPIASQITGGALNNGDLLQYDYEITMGTNAASTSYTAQLQNLTDGTDTGAGTVSGVDASIYNALNGSGAYLFFQTQSPGANGSGLTGVRVHSVTTQFTP